MLHLSNNKIENLLVYGGVINVLDWISPPPERDRENLRYWLVSRLSCEGPPGMGV